MALGLAPEFFQPAPFQNPDNPGPDEIIFYGKVSYGFKGGRARHDKVVDGASAVIEQVQRRRWLHSSDEAATFCHHLRATMYTEVLWNCVTTKDSSWSYQNEMRILSRNFLKDPQLRIVNPPRPRVELIQPRLKENIVEVMVGPKADAGAIKRVASPRALKDRRSGANQRSPHQNLHGLGLSGSIHLGSCRLSPCRSGKRSRFARLTRGAASRHTRGIIPRPIGNCSSSLQQQPRKNPSSARVDQTPPTSAP